MKKSALPAAIGFTVIAAGVVAGLYGRFAGLGARPLATDEYYFVRSVGWILEGGLPVFPSGGGYLRGLLPQYATAVSAWWLGESGFALRLTPALWSLGSIALALAYARRRLGPWAAAALAVALLVSSWHIEFARFARMYAALQCTTLLFLIAVEREAQRDQTRASPWPHIAFVAMALCHEMAVLLAPLLLLPLVDAGRAVAFPTWASRLRFGIAGAALAVFAYTLPKLGSLGVSDRFPDGYVPPAATTSVLRVPDLALPGVGVAAVLGLVLLAAVFVSGLLATVRLRGGRIGEADLLAAGTLVAASAHQLGLALGFGLAWLFRCRVAAAERVQPRVIGLLAAAVAVALVWLVVALGTGTTSPGALRRAFVGWPDIVRPLLRPAWIEFPWLTTLVAAATFQQLAANARRPWPEIARHPAALTLGIALCVGIFDRPLATLRYVYLLYPIALCTIVLAIRDVLARMAPLERSFGRLDGAVFATFLLAFGLSGDFDPRHIAHVDSEPVTYRTGRYARHEGTWYPRYDFRSVSRFLSTRPLAEDEAIVLGNAVPVEREVAHPVIIYHPRDSLLFYNSSRRHGTLERWSNAPLTSTPEELRARTSGARRVWVVRRTDAWAFLDVRAVWGERVVRASTALLGRGARVEVVEVVLSEPRPAEASP